jgi:hypothetical protein
MITRDEIIFLKTEGKNLAEIARALNVSRQRIHQIYSGYVFKYQKSGRYLEYRRHSVGHKHPYKPCRLCKEENQAKLTIDKQENLLYT